MSEVFGDARPAAGEEFFNRINTGALRLIGGGKLLEELSRRENFRVWWRNASLGALVEQVDDEAVNLETARLTDEKACRSNDAHVIALAAVGGARLLYTNDRRLQSDFKNRQLIDNPPGKVYSTRRSGAFSKGKKSLLATSSCRFE